MQEHSEFGDGDAELGQTDEFDHEDQEAELRGGDSLATESGEVESNEGEFGEEEGV